MSDPCDPQSEAPCSQCLQNAYPGRQCHGICKPWQMFNLLTDTAADSWLCRVSDANTEIRCQRSFGKNGWFCLEHQKEYSQLPPDGLRLITGLAQQDNIVEKVSTMAEKDEQRLVYLFLTSTAVTMLQTIHYQQFLAVLTPGWHTLLHGLSEADYKHPGLWIRLALRLTEAMINMNIPGKIPLLVTLAEKDVFQWKQVANSSQSMGLKFLISGILKLNQATIDDYAVIHAEVKSGRVNPADLLPDEIRALMS